MIAKEVRRLAEVHSLQELEALANDILENEADPATVEGSDPGEKLTHVMLATRVRVRVDAGEALKDVFRDEMRSVRGVLTND